MPPLPTLGYRQLRNGRRSIPGQLYLITTVTQNRQPFFLDNELARTTARAMSSAELWLPSRCLCWVLMPDHWHGLVELGEAANLSRTMQRVKGITSHGTHPHRVIGGPLWAKGFHDHALRKDEERGKVARYLINNPIRKGLVDDPMDYPYWDAYFIGEDTDVQLD